MAEVRFTAIVRGTAENAVSRPAVKLAGKVLIDTMNAFIEASCIAGCGRGLQGRMFTCADMRVVLRGERKAWLEHVLDRDASELVPEAWYLEDSRLTEWTLRGEDGGTP